MEKYLYISWVISLLAVIFSPLLLLQLFDYGCWMVFCFAIYYIVWAIYIACTEMIIKTIGDEYSKTVTPNRKSVFVSFFAVSSFACSVPIVAFPLLSISEEFLCKVNYLFGTHISTTYEGGIICIMMFVGGLYLLFGYTSSVIPVLAKVLKTDFKKTSTCGILSSVVLFVCLYAAFIYYSKDVSYSYDGSFNTQMEQEERNMDYKIENEKNRMIQKSVDDYNRQWNN